MGNNCCGILRSGLCVAFLRGQHELLLGLAATKTLRPINRQPGTAVVRSEGIPVGDVDPLLLFSSLSLSLSLLSLSICLSVRRHAFVRATGNWNLETRGTN
jgi:hypothetical protein